MNSNTDLSQIDFSKLKPVTLGGGGFLRGAHHPHCERHHNHLLWVWGHPLCLGCTCMYSGIIIGLPLTLTVEWSFVAVEVWFFSHLLLLLPTLIQPRIQKKLYKIVARFMLGLGVSSYILSGLLLISPPFSVWAFRISILIFFVFLHRLLKYIRNRYTYNPCSDCPLGTFPTCDWNLPRLLSENPDIELFTTINESLQR
jgi:uncharacterized membrane protein